MNLQAVAQHLSHKHKVAVHIMPDEEAICACGCAEINAYAVYEHRCICVPRWEAFRSDEHALVVYLHEMGHICSRMQFVIRLIDLLLFTPVAIATGYRNTLSSAPYRFRFLTLWLEYDAWQWAEKQYPFTPLMKVMRGDFYDTYRRGTRLSLTYAADSVRPPGAFPSVQPNP